MAHPILGTRLMSRLSAAVLLAGLFVLTGCTSGTTNNHAKPAVSGSAGSTGTKSATDAVDPQVLNDVIDSVFQVPGTDALRNMRVSNFIEDWMAASCGITKHFPIDRTWDRPDQTQFPDLDLITEKGFTEPDPMSSRNTPLPGFRKGCNPRTYLLKKMPSYQTWMNLNSPWQDVVTTVHQERSVVALKAPFAQCLRNGTRGLGIVVSSVDPAGTFLPELDKAIAADKVTLRNANHRIARLFVKCGRAYFDRTQKLLEAKRPAMIERNRELLERAASQLVAMGYVP